MFKHLKASSERSQRKKQVYNTISENILRSTHTAIWFLASCVSRVAKSFNQGRWAANVHDRLKLLTICGDVENAGTTPNSMTAPSEAQCESQLLEKNILGNQCVQRTEPVSAKDNPSCSRWNASVGWRQPLFLTQGSSWFISLSMKPYTQYGSFQHLYTTGRCGRLERNKSTTMQSTDTEAKPNLDLWRYFWVKGPSSNSNVTKVYCGSVNMETKQYASWMTEILSRQPP